MCVGPSSGQSSARLRYGLAAVGINMNLIIFTRRMRTRRMTPVACGLISGFVKKGGNDPRDTVLQYSDSRHEGLNNE